MEATSICTPSTCTLAFLCCPPTQHCTAPQLLERCPGSVNPCTAPRVWSSQSSPMAQAPWREVSGASPPLHPPGWGGAGGHSTEAGNEENSGLHFWAPQERGCALAKAARGLSVPELGRSGFPRSRLPGAASLLCLEAPCCSRTQKADPGAAQLWQNRQNGAICWSLS